MGKALRHLGTWSPCSCQVAIADIVHSQLLPGVEAPTAALVTPLNSRHAPPLHHYTEAALVLKIGPITTASRVIPF